MRARIRKWGNSYGILLSKRELERRKLRENQLVDVEIGSAPDIRELFGIMKSRRLVDDIAREAKEGAKDDVLL